MVRQTGLGETTKARVETGTIIVVDDEPIILNRCQQILRLGGYDVLPARDAQEALRLFQNSKTTIRLALLDVIMPGTDGLELAKQLQSTSPNTRVVLMSGYGSTDIKKLGRQNPYRIIWKPFQAESLLRMIGNVLETPPGPFGTMTVNAGGWSRE